MEEKTQQVKNVCNKCDGMGIIYIDEDDGEGRMFRGGAIMCPSCRFERKSKKND